MKNILIACISLFDFNDETKKQYKYTTGDISVSARQTNEACAKYLLKKLGQSGKTIDNYFLVESVDVKNSSTAGELTRVIGEFCEAEKLTAPEIFSVKLNEEDETAHSFDRVLGEISQKVLEIGDDVTIHLDMAGGKRDNYIFIQLLTKLLSFYGIEVHTYYADLGAREIVNTDESFRHMQILDGVNEFVRSGSATALRECFRNSQSPTVKSLLKVMEEFSNAIQLCSTDIGNILLRLNQQLDQTEKNVSGDKDALFIVKTMIPLIRSKFNINNKDSNYAALSIVKWCLENNLIQQALTVYNEKVSDIIIDNKFVEINEVEIGITRGANSHKLNADIIFSVLNNAFEDLKSFGKGSSAAKNEIARCKSNDNNYKQVIGAYFFEEVASHKGVTVNIDGRLFKNIMCDTRFAMFARNRVNHASDTDTYKEDIISMFKKYDPKYKSYETKDSFTPDNLKSDLLRAVDNLEQALNEVKSSKQPA